MKDRIQKNIKFIASTTLSLTIAAVITLVTETPMSGRMIHNQGIDSLIQAKIFFSTLNIGLLTALTFNYGKIYRRMTSRFVQSLFLTSGALLVYAVTSSPLIHIFLGFRGGGLGPFTFIPDIFVSVASLILLYRSYQ